MRLQLTIVLILLNVALAGTIFYLEKNPASGRAFDQERRMVLPGGFVDEAGRLEIEGRRLIKSWVLERAQNNWEITKPVKWPANYYAVSRLVNQLKFLEWETRFSIKDMQSSGRSLADYGLAEPKAILTIVKGEHKIALPIGESTELGNRLYILSPDGLQVLVVNRELLDSISLDLDDLRSQNIFDIPLFEIRALSLQTAPPDNLRVRMAREGEQWTFEAPIRAAADARQVNAALGALASVKITAFHEPDPAKQGLANPALRITLEGNNRRQTILVGEPVPGQPGQRFAMLADNPTVFSVPQEPFLALRSAQESLREKKFVQFNPEILTAIEITMSDHTLTLQKLERGAWQALQKDAAGNLISWPADAEVINKTVTAMLNLEAARFISDAPAAADLENFGFNDPQRRVTLKCGAEKNLLIGNLEPASSLLYAKLADQPSVYLISPDILPKLKIQALYYRQRVLWEQPQAATVSKLLLIEQATGRAMLDQAIEPGKETWETKLAVESEARRKAVIELAAAVKKFSVREYLRDKFADAYELDRETKLPWKYRLEAIINLPGGEAAQTTKLTLFFTERVGGTTQYGGSQDYNVIFALPQNMIDALHALTFQETTSAGELIPPGAPAPAP